MKKFIKVVLVCIVAFYGLFFVGGLIAMATTSTPSDVVENDSIKSEFVSKQEPKPKKHNGKCLARNKNGTYCKRAAKEGYYYCWQHLKYYK